MSSWLDLLKSIDQSSNPCAEIPLEWFTTLPSGKIQYTLNGKVHVIDRPQGFRLIVEYPGCNRKVGAFEPFTSGDFLKYPGVWKPVYHKAHKFGL